MCSRNYASVIAPRPVVIVIISKLDHPPAGHALVHALPWTDIASPRLNLSLRRYYWTEALSVKRGA